MSAGMLAAAGLVVNMQLEIDRLNKRDAVLCEMLHRWLGFSADVVPSCAAGWDELQMLRARTERLLPENFTVPPNADLSGRTRSA